MRRDKCIKHMVCWLSGPGGAQEVLICFPFLSFLLMTEIYLLIAFNQCLPEGEVIQFLFIHSLSLPIFFSQTHIVW